jgi:hypothetical protein
MSHLKISTTNLIHTTFRGTHVPFRAFVILYDYSACNHKTSIDSSFRTLSLLTMNCISKWTPQNIRCTAYFALLKTRNRIIVTVCIVLLCIHNSKTLDQLSWAWKQKIPQKRWHLSTEVRNFLSWRIVIWIFTDLNTEIKFKSIRKINKISFGQRGVR